MVPPDFVSRGTVVGGKGPVFGPPNGVVRRFAGRFRRDAGWSCRFRTAAAPEQAMDKQQNDFHGTLRFGFWVWMGLRTARELPMTDNQRLEFSAASAMNRLLAIGHWRSRGRRFSGQVTEMNRAGSVIALPACATDPHR